MAICSSCGSEEGRVKLFDVISSSGIVKLCSGCLSGDAVPLKVPTEKQINSINKSGTLYQRLSREAGINPEEHKKSFFGNKSQEDLRKQEVNLRLLLDRSNDAQGKTEVLPQRRDDLIENFHWVIMRARRAKKFTITQVAKEIGETEASIKLAEQGVLPEGDYRIVSKLETVLGINILRPEIAERIRMQRTQLGFDNITTKEITIADLKDMKKEIPVEKKVPYWRRFMFGGAKKAKEQEEEEIRRLISHKTESGDDFFEDDDGATVDDFSEVEFDNTSVEISTGISMAGSKSRETGNIPKTKQSLADKEDLTDEEIDDLIFGRK